jgi:orotidine-5'-phosphate decarboxylase
MSERNPILCAIDTPDAGAAHALAAAVGPFVGGLKLGLEFFAANGPDAVRRVAGAAPLFLDLKLHDIPNTVAGAVGAVAPLAPLLLTVHCAGGIAMMKAAAATAADEAARGGVRRMNIIGVTVLTSLNDDDLASVGQNGPVQDQVRRLAALARQAGLDGVVCSPHEVAALRRDCGADFLLVVPGIRPANGTGRDDQKRVMTPRQALDAGADYLVIGRPVTAAPDPEAAARAIRTEIAR